eukprot:CAMPEP_0181226036 /NCGR_PEP_ID=MMETSP1096-20121128/32038_1 /TAXON_ID=156174 ORGANISM="Chrysochromulina ericina, Strain CCMP281" /NCGR_SAMPLE_ID=MMETSP1096 /ASSEMBLY_ACC=CAM_ASM_000453 /LENGTH=139 /DNA_ID=CAMNT_0023319343 /DNA_START=71 /DNA_END=490 /DNA_ORIENTATION=-
MRQLALVSLIASAVALRLVPASALRTPNHAQRSRDVMAQDQYGYGEQEYADPVQKQVPTALVEWWYVGLDNQEYGPVNSEELSRLYDTGQVDVESYVASPQMTNSDWLPLDQSGLQYLPEERLKAIQKKEKLSKWDMVG